MSKTVTKRIAVQVGIGVAIGLIGWILMEIAYTTFAEAMAAALWWIYIILAVSVILFREYSGRIVSLASDAWIERNLVKARKLFDMGVLSEEEYERRAYHLKYRLSYRDWEAR